MWFHIFLSSTNLQSINEVLNHFKQVNIFKQDTDAVNVIPRINEHG